MSDTITLERPPAEAPELREILKSSGFTVTEAPYAFFRAKKLACTITFYHSGKLVLQGKGARDWRVVVDPEGEAGVFGTFAKALDLHPDPPPEQWIGVDESGKGDFFGPLVVVAAAVKREQVELLAELGVADSKKLGAAAIREMATALREIVRSDVIVIGPPKYNQLYEKFRNLNHLLAWAHARSIANVLEQGHCPYVLCDRFASEDLVENALARLVTDLPILDQRVRAEADPAVAVASILARDAFVRSIARLSKHYGVNLHKGAGPPVVAAGRRFVEKFGRDALAEVAKVHFKTYDTI